MGRGCFTTTRQILTRGTTWSGAMRSGICRTSTDGTLQARLKDVGDEFLPAREYVQRANVGHYKEVNTPVGHMQSPWGDRESTLERAKS